MIQNSSLTVFIFFKMTKRGDSNPKTAKMGRPDMNN